MPFSEKRSDALAKSIEEIRRLGISRIKAARKGKDSVLNGIQFIQQFDHIIHPRCVNTILEKNNYAWDTRDGRQLNIPIDDFNHLMDAERYAVEKYATKMNNIEILR